MGCTSKLVYLSPDDRYDVWVVKAAERPELLSEESALQQQQQANVNVNRSAASDDDEMKHSDSEECSGDDDGTTEQQLENQQHHSPQHSTLEDGCDIPGWRSKGLVELQDESLLRVGPGCLHCRRESQLPVLATNTSSSDTNACLSSSPMHQWETLRRRLMDPDQLQCPTPTRVSYRTVQHLHPWFERDNVPAVIDGCTETWKAMKTCRFAALVAAFGDVHWRFSDTHGETMTLETYRRYIRGYESHADDAPLAVYDSQFGIGWCNSVPSDDGSCGHGNPRDDIQEDNEDNSSDVEEIDPRSVLCQDYDVPKCFDKDLFACIPDDEDRPPYRWILIGPARSGTGLHVDPVGTHAWVTLVEGCKRWVLFPPNSDQAAIGMITPQIPSVVWFRDHYQTALENSTDAMEFIQYPGETVYVPAGWPHLVLNLELTVAITHNYATEYPSMPRLWKAIAEGGETELAKRFRMALRDTRPDLCSEATK